MTLPRRRWLVAACVAVALALCGWWVLPERPNRFGELGRRYIEVRIGMGSDRAIALMSQPYAEPPEHYDPGRSGERWWGHEESDPPDFDIRTVTTGGRILRRKAWVDGQEAVALTMLDGRVIAKSHSERIPAWQGQARAWLVWLRGLIGL